MRRSRRWWPPCSRTGARRRGIELAYPTLRRYAIAKLGFGRATTTIPVADGQPGDEIQVDTGWMNYLDPAPGGGPLFNVRSGLLFNVR
jgi:hypothetical protein